MNTVDAKTAARLLGVKPASLYAYVSRGLIRSAAKPDDAKARLYVRADIDALLKRRNRARKPAAAAATALDWGLPVLETAITNIDAGRLLYRGQDAARLARNETFESVAALLWGADGDPFVTADFA